MPQCQPITAVFDVPRQAGRKSDQRKKRTPSTKNSTKEINDQYHHYEYDKN